MHDVLIATLACCPSATEATTFRGYHIFRFSGSNCRVHHERFFRREIDTTSPGGVAGAVSDPSTWAMMFIGLASLGFAGYLANRKATA
jgi:hypothetical protein